MKQEKTPTTSQLQDMDKQKTHTMNSIVGIIKSDFINFIYEYKSFKNY